MFPVSFAKGTSPTRSGGICRTCDHAYQTLAANVTAMINVSDVATPTIRFFMFAVISNSSPV